MAPPGKKTQPHGKRNPVSVIQDNLEQVEDLMSQGYTPRAIANKLGLKKRTSDRYRSLVLARWQKEHEATRPHQVQIMLGRLDRLSTRMEKAEAWGALASIKRLEADIRGLRAPDRLEVKAAVAVADITPVGPDLSRLTDEQLAALRAAYAGLALQGVQEARGEVIDHEPVE